MQSCPVKQRKDTGGVASLWKLSEVNNVQLEIPLESIKLKRSSDPD
jgi:hypothetical protein